MVQSVAISDLGLVRTSNQDRTLIDKNLGLYLVADGVGGQSHGDTAAELAINASQYFLRATHDTVDASWPFGYDMAQSANENRLRTAFQMANRQVHKLRQASPEHSNAATTIVGALIDGPVATVGNVGDSRVYLMRDAVLKQLTVDDSWVGQLVRDGAITEAQARNHSMKNVVTQTLGLEKVEVHTSEQRLAPGDMLLITTDGVHGVLEHSAMCSILASCRNLEQGAKRMIEAALDQGGPDNASCILLRHGPE
jgi:serine/threonine protein phosphatase PrpC